MKNILNFSRECQPWNELGFFFGKSFSEHKKKDDLIDKQKEDCNQRR